MAVIQADRDGRYAWRCEDCGRPRLEMAHRGPRPDEISPAQVGLLQVETGQIQPLQVEAAQVRPLAPSATATMTPSSSTPICSFLQARRCFDALCLWAFHSPEPRILSPVESTIKPSWARVSFCTWTIWFLRVSVVWSGALRSRPFHLSSETRKPSVWRSGRLKSSRRLSAVNLVTFKYLPWPPRRPEMALLALLPQLAPSRAPEP